MNRNNMAVRTSNSSVSSSSGGGIVNTNNNNTTAHNNINNSKRKDVKKSSYYVWFLGAKESGGLRGREYVRPAVKYFLEKEREVEPVKVTLQVSTKGLKMVQSPGAAGEIALGLKGGPKNAPVKHFIPHHAVTCVVQEDEPNLDIVSCILLLYNPLTRCPVHVHSYRCDSTETACMLKAQLQALADRPDNQRKFQAIEARLQAKGLLSPVKNSSSSASDSCSSDGKPAAVPSADRIANLYDSLAAELREKLSARAGKQGAEGSPQAPPILLPPRDYDTIHRQRGNLMGIESRRCLTAAVVGVLGAHPATIATTIASNINEDSSGKSSGIGSDDSPSPVHQRPFHPGDIQAHSSSDEEWAEHSHPEAISPQDLILVQPLWQQRSQKSSSSRSAEAVEMPPSQHRRRPENRQLRPPSPPPAPLSPRERFHDAKEKFQRLEEQEKILKKTSREHSHHQKHHHPQNPRGDQYAYNHDTGYASSGGKERKSRDFSPDDEERGRHHNQQQKQHQRVLRSQSSHEYTRRRRRRSPRNDHVEVDDDDHGNYRDEVDKKGPRQRNPHKRDPSSGRHDSWKEEGKVSGGSTEEVFRARSRHSMVENMEQNMRAAWNKSKEKLEANSSYPFYPPEAFHVPRVERRQHAPTEAVDKDIRRRSGGYLPSKPRVGEPSKSLGRESSLSSSNTTGTTQSSNNSGGSYHELADHERYPGLDRETARVHHHFPSPDYRHQHHIHPPLEMAMEDHRRNFRHSFAAADYMRNGPLPVPRLGLPPPAAFHRF